jgi:hypothetical protein
MSIVVQEVRTRWTKQSRGGTRAALRSAFPRVLRIPHPSVGDSNVLFHLVELDEAADFQPCDRCDNISLDRVLTRVGTVDLLLEHETLRVQFQWSSLRGAPRRTNARAIRLRPAEWCQGLSNARSGYDRSWSYEDISINVAYHPASLDLFQHTLPQQQDDSRADLW